jgi:hypothetical protein
VNLPRTVEGAEVWSLALRLEGQVRVADGRVLGWDMTAALALAGALGMDARATAELLPAVEARMARAVNERLAEERRAHDRA